MKKLLLILVVLAVAAPCVAGTITFDAVDNSNGTCTLTYYVTGAGSVPPVAMGLLVTANKNITAVTDIDEFFEIYMDAAYSMDPCYTYGDGTPIADPDGPGEIALPQMKFVISMGGLGGETKPKTKFPKTGSKQDPATLCVLHSDTQPPNLGSTTGTITICPLRGGVIDEDGEVMDPNSEGSPGALALNFTISECMPYNATTVDFGLNDRPVDRATTTYAEWVAVGKPKCWCYQAQCRGNADGITDGGTKAGYYHVGPDDFNLIVQAWDTMATPKYWVKEPPFGPGIATRSYTRMDIGVTYPAMCANFNRTKDGGTKAGYYYVGPDDFNRIVAAWDTTATPKYWMKEPTFGPGIPTNDCGGSLIGP
jgi:hypothetical protein